MTDDLRVEQVDDLKVADLRRELSHRRLSCTGRKSELQQRLKEYLSEDYVDDEADKEKSEGAEETEETIAQTRRRRTSSTGSRSVSPKPGSDIERPGSPYTRSMARRDRDSLSPKPPSRGNTPPPTPRSAASSDAVAPRSARPTRRSPKPDQSPLPPTPASSGNETPASPAPTRGRRRSRTNEGAEPVSPKAEDQPTTTQPQEQPKAAQSPKPVASPTPAPAGKASPKPVEAKSPKPTKAPAVLETLLMDADEDILADELTEVQTAEPPPPQPQPAKKAAPAPAPALAPKPVPTARSPQPAARSPKPTPAPAPAPVRSPAVVQSSTTEEAEFQRVRDPHPAKCAPSVTVRIDGLKRPFPLPKFKAALEAMSGVKVVDSENFFISMKRTHCYLTMDTVEQAEAFRNRICGMKYHDGLLSAEFSDLTAVEAGQLSEEERDLRMKVMASRAGKAAAAAPAAKTAPQRQQQQQQQEQEAQPAAAAKATSGTVPAPESRRKLVPIEHAAANSIFRGAIGSLKRQASGSSVEDDNSAKAATKRTKPVQENGAGKRARPDSGEEHEEKQLEEDDREATKRMRDAKPAEPEAPIATLDDLFRKTTAKPALYWLPVSEEEVQRRREAIARFQAQSSATTGTT